MQKTCRGLKIEEPHRKTFYGRDILKLLMGLLRFDCDTK